MLEELKTELMFKKSVEGMNATNETANVQRIVRTPTPGNTSTGQCYNYGGKGHYARNCPKPRVRDSKYFMEQMLLAKQDEAGDEAGGILTNEQNDFLFADASKMEEIKELSANICLMARIQPADQNSDDEPSYESAFVKFLEADERAKRVQKQADSQLKISENEDKYHDTILDLEEKLKKNVDMFLKIGNSLQAMFMLGPKPLSVYDQQLKHGLGYSNPYTLTQAISECPKLYVASRTESFVEQTCSSSSYIPFVKILETKTMPSELPLINELFNIKVGFEKLFLLIKQNSKRASMFYTSKEEIALNDFCRDQVKPLLNELLDYFDGFQNLFQRDIKEMKDAFEQNDVYLDEIERQNDLLKDQLLEASLKHDIELCALLNHECVDKSLHDELEQVKKKSL
ncbi:retrovirus-related pol polyprotein from transposon TNT 1-94 [Tanacetum coccineum]